jgi:chorismate mutase / prephenate dehydratase
MVKTQLEPKNEALLSQKRAEIDAIDRELVRLLKQRILQVQEVGKLKASDLNTNCYIRPGREANILRAIYQEFADTQFDPMAAALIWRQIIAASTNLEQKIIISYYTTELDKNYIGDFFSTIIHYHAYQDAVPVLTDLASGRCTVGVIPFDAILLDSTVEFFKRHSAYKVFVGLPFVQTDNSHYPHLLAIAAVPPEATDDDYSLFALETENLEHVQPMAEVIGQASGYRLVAIPGFCDADKLRAQAGSPIGNILWLGSYATPIRHMPR